MAITGMTRILILLLTFIFSLGQVSAREFLRVCYFPSWANERASPNARYDISDIDPSLCTHIIYAFGKLDVDSKLLVATYPLVEDSRPGFDGRFKAFNNLKKRNGRLKTLLSVGGQNDNGDGFAAITENDVILSRFAKTTVDFLRKRNFDGIDIDWEYPNKDTRQRFVKLLKALREAFDAEDTSQKLVLTVAGPAGKWTIDDGYDIPGIARYVDYVNLMTYDYTVKSAQVTAFNSPLFSRNDIRFSPVLSMNWTVHYWQQHGLPFSKMLVGMTGVGRRLVLNNTEQYDLGSPVTGEVRKGDYYGIEAGLAYPEICLLLTSQDRLTFYDYEQRCPYLVKGDDWVGYDDPQSITEKITWMMATGVAGLMFWSLDQDDFSGKMCDSDRYPLMNAMLKAIGVENQPELTENVDPDISKEFLRVCVFPNWANKRTAPSARYDISDIDPSLCTHIIYAFGKLDVDSKLLVATYPDAEESRSGFEGRYKEFNNLKKRNSRLQTLLSVGGQNDNGLGFAAITESDSIMTNFAKTTVNFLRKRNFDGFDIGIYPTADTKQRFVKLLRALREAFDAEDTSQKLLLTIAGAPGQWTIDDGFDIPEIARYVDFVNLMTYNYTVKTAQVTAFNSPLFSRNDTRFNPVLSMNWTVHYWQQKGLPFRKMLVGVTPVGRRLVLKYTDRYALGSPVTGEVRKGDYYEIEAGLAYPEICVLLKSKDKLTFYDYEQRCPVLVKGDDWVGYDDPQSVKEKVYWMLYTRVAGFMFWSLDQDDFSGKMCGSGTYPLLNAMLKAIGVEYKPDKPEPTDNSDPDVNVLPSKENGATTPCFSHAHIVIATVFVVITMFI